MAEFRSCVKVEVAVLGSPSLIISLMVSVDVKQRWTRTDGCCHAYLGDVHHGVGRLPSAGGWKDLQTTIEMPVEKEQSLNYLLDVNVMSAEEGHLMTIKGASCQKWKCTP